jgi:hypothetical protein
VTPVQTKISVKLLHSSVTGEIVAESPRIQKILKIFEPTILPTAMSVCHFRAATIDVTSSGRDVPIATTVRPIIRSDIPRV